MNMSKAWCVVRLFEDDGRHRGLRRGVGGGAKRAVFQGRAVPRRRVAERASEQGEAGALPRARQGGLHGLARDPHREVPQLHETHRGLSAARVVGLGEAGHLKEGKRVGSEEGLRVETRRTDRTSVKES
jgi:hypothetical protein